MALKGNLRDFSVVQLFNLINLARKTGTLRLESSEGRASLSFREGKLVYATMGNAGSELIAALREGGLLTDEQARTMRERAGKRSDRELGLLLINAGYASQQDILQSMQARIMDNVYPLFAWSEGDFRFESDGLQVDGAVTVRIDLENVIMKGTRRLEEWERLQHELPDLTISLKFADRPRASLRDINLNVQEWRVISFINPRNTIEQIARYNNLSDFQIRKIVYGLLQAGLVEIVRLVPEEPKRPVEPERPQVREKVEKEQRRPDVKRNLVMRLIDRIREL